MENIDYTVNTSKSFDAAVKSVVSETEKAGFRVLYTHDIKETLGKKGFEIEPLKIIEICNAGNAYNAVQKDIRLALCLPCKINVYTKDGKTVISGMRPILIKTAFPDLEMGSLIQEVDTKIRAIVDKAR